MPLGFTFQGDSLSPSSSGPATSGLGISIQGITTGGTSTGGASIPQAVSGSPGATPDVSGLSSISPTMLLIVGAALVAVLLLKRR